MGRAMIVSASENGIEFLSQLIRNYGYSRISTISNGSEARRLINSAEYELVVINTPLTDEFGHELSIMMSEASTAAVILLCKPDIADEIYDKVSDFGVCVVQKPVTRSAFQQAVKLVQATRSRMPDVKKESENLLTKIDEMRLINRAKLALMQYLKFTAAGSQIHCEASYGYPSDTKRGRHKDSFNVRKIIKKPEILLSGFHF